MSIHVFRIISAVLRDPEESDGKVTNSHTRPSEVFRRNVAELRKRRGWSQAELARRLGVNRTTVVKVEGGQREVTLDEAFAYAGVLGAQPSRMMAPINGTPVLVWSGEPPVDGHIFRAWIRGKAFVRPDDVDYYPAEVDIDEWIERCRTTILYWTARTQEIIDACGDAIDPDSEAAWTILDRIDAANDALDQFFRVMAERDDPRPVARERVRRAA
jgi:transcriptional regulator with XRE-family HTH domain